MSVAKELVIYTDESEKTGRKFSNFFGGALVRSTDLLPVTEQLMDRRRVLGLTGEIKWSSTKASVVDRYEAMMKSFFEFVAADRVKVRVMFTQNRNVPQGLTEYHRQNDYFILYYQFIKHAFGLPFAGSSGITTRVRLYLDELPHTKERCAQFKSFVVALNKQPEFKRAGIHLAEDQIAEVRSHDHVLLQCLDVVLGDMHFRLNEKHLEKAPGGSGRGRRMLAKERLYEAICDQLCSLRPHFNIGISTGLDQDISNRWKHSYRHWLFVPAKSQIES